MKYTIITTVLAAFLLSPASFAAHCTDAHGNNLTKSETNENLDKEEDDGGTLNENPASRADLN